jgi:hypothetical protein
MAHVSPSRHGRDLNILVERKVARMSCVYFYPLLPAALRKSTQITLLPQAVSIRVLHDVSLPLLRAGRVSAFQEIVFDACIPGGSHQK